MIKTTPENMRRHLELLLAKWTHLETVQVDGKVANVAKAVVGLTAGAAESASAYLEVKETRTIAKGILGRSILEFGLSAVWVRLQGEPALASMHREHQRQRRVLAGEILRGGFEDFPELIDEATEASRIELPRKGPLEDTARHLELICGQLDTNPPLYAVYRMFSQYAHASLSVADRYTSGPDHPSKAQLDRPLEAVLTPFVWAVKASNDLLLDAPFSQSLATIEALMGSRIEISLKGQPETPSERS